LADRRVQPHSFWQTSFKVNYLASLPSEIDCCGPTGSAAERGSRQTPDRRQRTRNGQDAFGDARDRGHFRAAQAADKPLCTAAHRSCASSASRLAALCVPHRCAKWRCITPSRFVASRSFPLGGGWLLVFIYFNMSHHGSRAAQRGTRQITGASAGKSPAPKPTCGCTQAHGKGRDCGEGRSAVVPLASQGCLSCSVCRCYPP